MRLRKGSHVPFPKKISAGYTRKAGQITANVPADRITELMVHFLVLHQDEPVFFILETPAHQTDEQATAGGVVDAFHKDIYYIDGLDSGYAMSVLEKIEDIVVNDGMCAFGYGCHNSGDEIMLGRYNILTILSGDLTKYDGFFEAHQIRQTDRLVTAYDTFDQKHPGTSEIISTGGKSIYDIPEMLKDMGIYRAELREE